jgi:hypothetical protein
MACAMRAHRVISSILGVILIAPHAVPYPTAHGGPD